MDVEEINKLLHVISNSDNESESGSEISCTTLKSNRGIELDKEISNRTRRSGAARLPTRRPDPNVYNRNALLARENRRKKKLYLESVEKELEEARNINKSLLKALKKQFKVAQKLKTENQYLMNQLGNDGDTQKARIASPDNRATSPVESLGSCYSSSGGSSFELVDAYPLVCGNLQSPTDNAGTLQRTICPLPSRNDFIDDFFTEYLQSSSYDSTWNGLLDENCFGLMETPSNSAAPEIHPDTPGLNGDHTYFKGADHKTNCADVCTSSQLWSAGGTPPSQLLQDDDFVGNFTNQCIESL